MQESADDWALFWDSRNEEWLDGYCFAQDNIFWETDWVWSQHHARETGLVYVFDEPGEEE